MITWTMLDGKQIAVGYETLPDGIKPVGNCIEGKHLLGMQYFYGGWSLPS